MILPPTIFRRRQLAAGRRWLDRNGRMIRVDRNYVIYGNDQTLPILSGSEWESDPAIKPVKLPSK